MMRTTRIARVLVAGALATAAFGVVAACSGGNGRAPFDPGLGDVVVPSYETGPRPDGGITDGRVPDGADTAPDGATLVAQLCSTGAAWVTSAAPVQGVPAGARWVTVSGDELTVAWVVVSNGSASAFVADRAAPSVAFGPASDVTALIGNLADDRVALSGNGTILVAVVAGRRAIVPLQRADRSSAFSKNAALAAGVNAIDTNGDRDPGGDPPREFFAPVLSSGRDILFFGGIADTNVGYGIWSAPLDGAFGYHIEGMLQSPTLRSAGNNRVRPTGIAADGRTLFYFNEATGRTGAMSRDDKYGQFQNEVLLPAGRAQVSPNADCKKVYSTEGADGARTVNAFTAP
jgi:hypothetical protein